MIPALIMGNTVVLKTPNTGGLCHQPTLKLFAECFPPGVVNIIHGSGRELFGPIMKSGIVNCLAFIGTSTAGVYESERVFFLSFVTVIFFCRFVVFPKPPPANALHQLHPQPFTVRLALGLDAKVLI